MSLYNEHDGLVILLDVLGIKDIQDKVHAFKILANWDKVYEAFRTGIINKSEELKKHDLAPSINFTGFSDTIIISVPVTIHRKRHVDLTNRDDYWWMINILGEAIIPLLLTAISNDIFLRGAVSIGKFYVSNKMLIGPAIKDAADYYCIPKWVGVCAAPSASTVLNKEYGIMGDTLKIFNKCDIPIGESDSENGWALLWPKKDTGRVARQIIEQAAGQYKSISKGIYLKYMNTLKFYDQFA